MTSQLPLADLHIHYPPSACALTHRHVYVPPAFLPLLVIQFLFGGFHERYSPCFFPSPFYP